MELGVLSTAVGAALVAAGLVSVLGFPLVALSLLRPMPATAAAPTDMPAPSPSG